MQHQHWSEEDLVLAFYGELDLDLAACAQCRERFTALSSELSQIHDPVPVRGEEFGRWTWFRLQARLPAELKPARTGWRAAAVAAVALLIVGAFAAGRYGVKPEPPEGVGESGRVRAHRAALGSHFERTQLVLREIENTPAGEAGDFSGERERAESLLTANRLHRQEAESAGDPDMAALLEDVERVLLEVAHAPEMVPAEELDALRERIREQRITFRVKVGELQQEVLNQ
jgi:hypothetical protein